MQRISLKNIILCLLMVLCSVGTSMAQSSVKIGVVKYDGGGDWYGNPTSVPNLVKFCNENLKMNVETGTVEVGSPDIYNFAMVHLTGHGNVVFSNADVKNLREYLLSGGFLHIDDNYGLDKYIRREMKKVFPDADFVELPSNHPIYNQQYSFPKGLPKIHEHDGKPAQGFGLIIEGRLVCFYTYECDLGDGWENPEVHSDTQEIHQTALQMGANIVQYICTH
ncbi:MAG: DUF4159 domain-containing protein [Bacteroidales bacterium]|nr:DUF4159 domain-containing protein [Bacteroidales bacterium]